MLPEWAPNLHPMVVHFPIALLAAAVLVDAVSLFWRKHLSTAAIVLYVLGALGTVVSYLSGRAAADSVFVSGRANIILTTHADWGTVAIWFFVSYALLRLVVAWKARWGRRLAVHGPLVLLAVGGLFVIYKTADNGGRMVYEHGVGVRALDNMAADLEASQRELAQLRGRSEMPVVEEDGSWHWTPGPFATEAFAQAFEQQMGALAAASHQDTAVALTASRSPALFVLNQALSSVQVDLDLGLEDFSGSVQVVYNLEDSLSYYFTEFVDGRVRQGRMDQGEAVLMDDQPFTPGRWSRYRVVSDRTHFRAYADGTMIAHGHGAAPGPGPVGLRIGGEGTVLLGRIVTVSLQ